jgi:hypothetical protein
VRSAVRTPPHLAATRGLSVVLVVPSGSSPGLRLSKDLHYLISLMSAVDQRDGSRFTFEHVRDPLEPGEVWLEDNKLCCTGEVVAVAAVRRRRAVGSSRVMFLKGRQIGVTWVALAVDLAEALTIPGSTSLLFRQREDEAIDNMRRWWTLFQSLPPWLVGHVKVSKPDKADRPGRDGVVLVPGRVFLRGCADDVGGELRAWPFGAQGDGDEAAHVDLLLRSVRRLSRRRVAPTST